MLSVMVVTIYLILLLLAFFDHRLFENQMIFLQRSINLQINQSVINYENTKESLIISKQNLDLAQNVYNATERKYKEGVGSNLELIDSNNSLKIAQNQYYNSLYESIIASIDIKKTLGTLLNKKL